MKNCRLLLAVLPFFLALVAEAQSATGFITDPNSKEMLELAKPLEVDESKYGCGALLEPGKTYYVTTAGNDQADGLAWEKAWRTIKRGVRELKPGDTLLIGEGEYTEPQIEINVRAAQEGTPGRPIRIMAAPRQRVIVSGAPLFAGFQKVPGTQFTYIADFKHPEFRTVWEDDTTIELQGAGGRDRVDEHPGTFWHDVAGGKLYVRFSDSRGPEAHRGVRVMLVTEAAKAAQVPGAYLEGLAELYLPRDVRNAIRIHGSYIHLKGLWFKHQTDSVAISANVNWNTGQPLANLKLPLGGHHNTVEDCAFFSNENMGIFAGSGSQWNLIRNNYFIRGGKSCGILSQRCSDTLFIGNRIFSAGFGNRGAINNYAGVEFSTRAHIINNLLIDSCSMMWKPPSKETVFQGNIAPGSIYCTGTAGLKEADRVVFRNNLLGGTPAWEGEPFGPGGAGGNWAGPDKAFLNNFVAGFDSPAFRDARFADPAYYDYRLQSDSPLIGNGVGGYDRGAFPKPQGRILYVGTNGNDTAAGTSERLAFKTLKKAGAVLKPGDTLYVLPGEYGEPLRIEASGLNEKLARIKKFVHNYYPRIAASGLEEKPICVRAYHKGVVLFPYIAVNRPNVVLEGFTVRNPAGEGFLVRAAQVEVRNCTAAGCAGPGIRVVGGRGFVLGKCTLAHNTVGLSLEDGAGEATVRDSILADNTEAPIRITEDSRPGYHAGQNCYFGPNVDAGKVAKEMGSVVAKPLFVDAAKRDYRLRWDSPAATIAGCVESAGAQPLAPRVPEIVDVRVTGIRRDSVIVQWKTPADDTGCELQYRLKGRGNWILVQDPDQGIVHGAGIVGLKPATEYEFQITARSRRGGAATTPAASFTTAAREVPPITYHLSPDGDDGRDGRTPATAWRSIRKACFEVSPGDTVLVAPGAYHHAIAPLCSGTTNGRITFRKQGEGDAVIDCGRAIAPAVKLVARHYITVDGFSFIRLPTTGGGGVIYISDSRGSEILNCRTDRVMRDGGDILTVTRGKDLRIEGNLFWGGAQNIRIYYPYTSNVLVKNNTLAVCNFFHVTVYFTVDGVRFLNNIFYLPCSPGKNNGNYLLRGKVKNFSSDYNLYYSPYPEQKRMGRWEEDGTLKPLVVAENFEEWRQKMNCDKHGLWADPMFVEAPTMGGAKADFRLKPGSPAIGAGEGGVNLGAFGAAK